MIKREFYLNQIIRHMHNGEIKVITGIRRCGKSVLLFELFRDHLLEQGVPEDQIITIALDQRKYYKFRNPITLCEYIEDRVSSNKSKQFYLLCLSIRNCIKRAPYPNPKRAPELQ